MNPSGSREGALAIAALRGAPLGYQRYSLGSPVLFFGIPNGKGDEPIRFARGSVSDRCSPRGPFGVSEIPVEVACSFFGIPNGKDDEPIGFARYSYQITGTSSS